MIACASIYLLTLQSPTFRLHDPLILPLEPAPWWTLFDATRAELRVAASHILRLYDHTTGPDTKSTGLAARVQEKHGGLIDLATKAGIRAWLERHREAR